VLKASEIVSALLEDAEPSPEDLVQSIAGTPRYYVQIDRADKDRAAKHGVWSYRHRVRDRRNNGPDGKYLVVADNLGYMDAIKLAKELNDQHHYADVTLQNFKAEPAPQHYFGTV